MTSKLKVGLGSSEKKEDHSNTVSINACNQKPQYQKPMLIPYGDVRDITLGPTLGATESGCANVFRPGSGLPPGTCPPGGN